MLTKNDLYEIEKVLDIYSGMINETLNRYCQTAIHRDALKKKNPLEPIIRDLDRTRKRIKDIRDNLEKMRVKNDKV